MTEQESRKEFVTLNVSRGEIEHIARALDFIQDWNGLNPEEWEFNKHVAKKIHAAIDAMNSNHEE